MPYRVFLLNLIIIGFILLPNLLLIIFPPINIPMEGQKPIWWNVIIVLEWIGRLGVFIFPLFWELKINNRRKVIVLIVMTLCILGYYGVWLRYIMGGHEFSLLFDPLFFIPVPMALFPVLYLILAGILLESWPMIMISVIFAFGHILESLRNYGL